MQPGQQVQIDLKDAVQKKCEECGGEYFEQLFTVHILSALVSPTGQELRVQQPVLRCVECGEVLS